MKIRRRQVVDMTLRGGHGPHTADWRATRDKETLEVGMSEDALVTELWEAREEIARLRDELEELRLHVVELARLSGHSLLDDVADDIAAILRGDNHE